MAVERIATHDGVACDTAGLTSLLRRYWNHDSFRYPQEQIIRSVISGRDTLALMPTGGGKSVTFQLSGLVLGGLTLVITPLVSLMKDQVDNLRRRGIRAVFLHSGMTARENTIAWERIANGRVNFLYISPERLGNDRFMAELRNLPVRLVAVDEAHCITQWGYDFRPSYLNIPKIRRVHPGVPVLALTATATPATVDDICDKLELRTPAIFRKSFARDNISYIVRQTDDKLSQLLRVLHNTSGTAIVYVRSRRRTGDIAEFLTEHGISAVSYHAGLPYELKEERQNRWRGGEVRVVVATNAFGMGIDKPDVRVVVHCDVPPSLEEYYQEAGRAGRDGKPSYAVLLLGRADKGVMKRSITEAFPPREWIRKLYEHLCIYKNLEVGEGYFAVKQFEPADFCSKFRYRERDVRNGLQLLQSALLIDYDEHGDARGRLQILATREELYNVQLTPTAEKVLTACLRLFPGLFADYVVIREALLVRDTALDSQVIYETLLELGRRGIVHYIPPRRTPQLVFLTARCETRDVVIPRSVYEVRRDAMRRRMEAMLDFAYTSDGCRVSRMLAYFGQEDAGPCGGCDLCRSAGRKPRRPLSDHELRDRLLSLFSSPSAVCDYGDLLPYFGSDTDRAMDMHRWLVERGELPGYSHRLDFDLYKDL